MTPSGTNVVRFERTSSISCVKTRALLAATGGTLYSYLPKDDGSAAAIEGVVIARFA